MRQDRRRRQGGDELVRHLHPQGALQDRGQEDHGPRARRAVRLGRPPRRHHVPHRRRHRAHRHVEGVRRAQGARPNQARHQAPEDGRRSGHRLRPNGQRLRRRRGIRHPRRRRLHPLGDGHPRPGRRGRLPDPPRGPRVRWLGGRGHRRRHRRGSRGVCQEGGIPALPRGRRHLRRVQEGTRGRQDQEDRPRAAVQLRNRPEVPHAPVQQRHRQARAHRLQGDRQGYLSELSKADEQQVCTSKRRGKRNKFM